MMGEYGQVKTPRGLSTDYRLRARLYIGRSEEDALGPGYRIPGAKLRVGYLAGSGTQDTNYGVEAFIVQVGHQ
eukprot:4732624-Pyramimonas_sp.AAC.1